MMCARARLLLFTGLSAVWLIGRAVGDCTLPPHPTHGRHQPQGGDCGGADQPAACDGTPGTPAPEDWLLTVSCDPGYRHSDPGSADVPSVCTNGVWSIPQLPPCVIPNLAEKDRERCTVLQPPPNSQYRLLAEECGGENLPPGSAVPHDCILFLNCAPGYERRVGTGELLTHCANKTWNPHIPEDLCIRSVGASPVSTVTPPQEPSTGITPGPGTLSSGCVLPKPSRTRKFCSLAPGCEECDIYDRRCHVAEGSVIDRVKVVCARDYTIQTSDVAVCTSTGWYPPITNCIKLCPALVSDDLELKCRYGTDPVPCTKPALAGTTVSFECRPSFSEYSELKQRGVYRNIITCTRSGEWSDSLPPCNPGCGVSTLKVQEFSPTIIDGKKAHIGFFPWHAGLYYPEEKNGKVFWDQKCGGSLISERVVITAAHCVYDVANDVNNLRVALGKYYRSWDVQEASEEKRNVTDIKIPSQYNKNILTFDIALVLLSEKIKFGEFIMPVCRDFDEGIIQIQDNSLLYVVGWGKTGSEINSVSSEHLLYNSVKVMNETACKRALPYYYSAFEKFCAEKNNAGSITQKGDSGGGLTAVHKDGLHYLVGIVSAKIDDSLSMFTNVKWRYHLDWVDSKIRDFKSRYDR